MRNYKAIFKPLLITSIFVSFILVASPALAKGFNYLDFLCNKKTSGLIAVMCDLRERIEVLENQEPIAGPQGEQGKQGTTGLQGEKGEIGEPGHLVFPKPKFTSDWYTIPPKTAVIDIPHNVGGDIDDYFIDVQFKRPPANGTLTSHQTKADKIWWEDVEPNNIQIATNGDVTNIFDKVRVRIWVVGE